MTKELSGKVDEEVKMQNAKCELMMLIDVTSRGETN